MRTPAALFPFDSQLLPAVKLFEELQDKYTLRKLFSPPGFGLTGRDAGYSRNHPPVGMMVTDAQDPADPTWDALLLARTLGTEAIDNVKLENAAEHALQSGKSVLYFDNYSTDVPKKLWTLSDAYPGMVSLYCGNTQTPVNQRFSWDEYRYIDAPVVLVGGLAKEADTFEVVLRLTARLRADGFCVTAITRHPLGELFGLHTLTHIFDNKNLTEAEKILELNGFVRSLEATERPNLVLIEAPDAVIRYNNFAVNGFGIYTYMLCQAVSPDYFVCCVPCELAVGQFFQAISYDFEYRLGTPIHAAHVSNLVIDSMELIQAHSISYVHADLDAVREQIAAHGESSSIPLFDVVGNGAEGLYTHLCAATMLEGRENRGDIL